VKQYNLKYYVGIALIFIVNSFHSVMFENKDKYDVYLFYNHSRYLTNILYDISKLFSFSILTYFLISLNRKIFKPLFIMSIFTWFSYFIFYNQESSLILIPIYVILVLLYEKKVFK
jgi:hypothetical protein